VTVDSVTSLTSLRTSQWFRLLRPLYIKKPWLKTLIDSRYVYLCPSVCLRWSSALHSRTHLVSADCRLLLHPSAICRHVDATRSHARLFTTQQNDVVSRDSPHPVPSNVAHLPPGHLPLDTDICPGPNHNRSLTLTSLRWPWFLGSLHDAANSALGRRRQISIDSLPLTGYRRDRQTEGRTDTVPLHRRSPLELDSVNKTVTLTLNSSCR